jgi:hypothetical protein
MHFCMDEVMAIMMLVPGLAFAAAWLRGKLHHRKNHPTCTRKDT